METSTHGASYEQKRFWEPALLGQGVVRLAFRAFGAASATGVSPDRTLGGVDQWEFQYLPPKTNLLEL